MEILEILSTCENCKKEFEGGTGFHYSEKLCHQCYLEEDKKETRMELLVLVALAFIVSVIVTCAVVFKNEVASVLNGVGVWLDGLPEFIVVFGYTFVVLSLFFGFIYYWVKTSR